jgi:hypothetical protein
MKVVVKHQMEKPVAQQGALLVPAVTERAAMEADAVAGQPKGRC